MKILTSVVLLATVIIGLSDWSLARPLPGDYHPDGSFSLSNLGGYLSDLLKDVDYHVPEGSDGSDASGYTYISNTSYDSEHPDGSASTSISYSSVKSNGIVYYSDGSNGIIYSSNGADGKDGADGYSYSSQVVDGKDYEEDEHEDEEEDEHEDEEEDEHEDDEDEYEDEHEDDEDDKDDEVVKIIKEHPGVRLYLSEHPDVHITKIKTPKIKIKKIKTPKYDIHKAKATHYKPWGHQRRNNAR